MLLARSLVFAALTAVTLASLAQARDTTPMPPGIEPPSIPARSTPASPVPANPTPVTPAIAPSTQSASELQVAKIVSVVNAQTVRVEINGQPVTLQLACISTPSTVKQSDLKKAGDRLKQLLPKGQLVNLQWISASRTLAIVFKNQTAVNVQMVAEGHAIVHPQQSNLCPTLEGSLLRSQEMAQQRRSGIWKYIQ